MLIICLFPRHMSLWLLTNQFRLIILDLKVNTSVLQSGAGCICAKPPLSVCSTWGQVSRMSNYSDIDNNCNTLLKWIDLGYKPQTRLLRLFGFDRNQTPKRDINGIPDSDSIPAIRVTLVAKMQLPANITWYDSLILSIITMHILEIWLNKLIGRA